MTIEAIGETIVRFVGPLITGRPDMPATPHSEEARRLVGVRRVYDQEGTTPDTLRRAELQGLPPGTTVHLLLESGEWVTGPHFKSVIVDEQWGHQIIIGQDESGNPQVATFSRFSTWRAEVPQRESQE